MCCCFYFDCIKRMVDSYVINFVKFFSKEIFYVRYIFFLLFIVFGIYLNFVRICCSFLYISVFYLLVV